jgi:hypothetical protein
MLESRGKDGSSSQRSAPGVVRNDDDDDVDDDEATSSASNETPAPWPKVDPESLPKTMMKCKEKTMVRMPPRPRKRKVQRSCRSNLSPSQPQIKN